MKPTKRVTSLSSPLCASAPLRLKCSPWASYAQSCATSEQQPCAQLHTQALIIIVLGKMKSIKNTAQQLPPTSIWNLGIRIWELGIGNCEPPR
jgi:hypothetical protein